MKELSNELKCPQCGGMIEVPADCSTFVCPYCNTTIQAKTGTIFEEHYMMRLQYGLNEAKEKMFNWGLKQLGTPDDIEESEISNGELIYWPFWVVEVSANATYEGVQSKPVFTQKDVLPRSKVSWDMEHEAGTIDLDTDFFVPANPEMPEQLKDYSIPIRRKDYYDRTRIVEERGETRGVMVSHDEALDTARDIMLEILRQEALQEIEVLTKMEPNLEIKASILVEIPIWHFEYTYNGTRYDALVDGSSGRIISMNFPMRHSFRATLQLVGYLHLGVGGGIGLLLIYLGLTLFDGIFPTYFGIALLVEMIIFTWLLLRNANSIGEGEEAEK